jgi:tetratricopeptide (TPR) repeat protein
MKVRKETTYLEVENEIRETLSSIEEYLIYQPEDIEALEDSVHLEYVLGNFEKASDLGIKLIELDPINYMHYHKMGNIKTKMQKWDDMIYYRQKAYHLEESSHMLFYLSTSYLVWDANYALDVLNTLDDHQLGSEEHFLLNYKEALENYVKDSKFDTINDLVYFIPDKEIMYQIIQEEMKKSQSAEELSKLNELSEMINEY